MTQTAPTATATPAHRAEHERRRGAVLVLLGRQARRRDPCATVWTVVSYDPETRVPVADIAQRWQPAGVPGPTGAVPEPVARWVSTVLGPDVAISVPADDLAGPCSWYLHSTAARTEAGGFPDPAALGQPVGSVGEELLTPS